MKDAQQCRDHICIGGINYFGDIKPGDLAFIRLKNEETPDGLVQSHTHRLWKLIEIVTNSEGAHVGKFEEIFQFNPIYTRYFPHLKLFKLSKSSIVLTFRPTPFGFVKLELSDENLFSSVISSKDTFNKYIANADNYRRIKLISKKENPIENSENLQLIQKSPNTFSIYDKGFSFLGKDFLDAFDSDRFALFDRYFRQNPNSRANGSQRIMYDWIKDGGNDEHIFLYNFWDFFCSSQSVGRDDAEEEGETESESENAIADKNIKIKSLKDIPLNTIFYGPPGTGKTRNTIIRSVSIVENKDVSSENYADVLKRFKKYRSEGYIGFITFHQSYGYEDFIEGIKPDVNSTGLSYKLESGVFKKFCETARKLPDINAKTPKKCCFIIDEINRGNISKIFGELITLIEKSKRDGNDECLSCKLTYSSEPFSIPNYIYLVGTMNTADRSLVQLDTALRRRFDFEEMMPQPSLLADIKVGKIEIHKLLMAMNDRISVLLDRDHQIGHSYFMQLKREPTLECLSAIFKNKIIPLLQEYFYDDYNNIKLVLNDDNSFIAETNDSAYLYNLKKGEITNKYRIIPPGKGESAEEQYIRIYTDITSSSENE